MSRISQQFEALQKRGRKALVAYIVSGDPNPAATLLVMHKIVEAGADIIELGVPFSDPMAEGPVIQRGHERALKAGTSLNSTLDLIAEFRKTDTVTPVILMGYANPVERMGYRRFAERAAQVGLDAILTVDLPPEELGELKNELAVHKIDNLFLLAPTTAVERARNLVSNASGFLYYVSLKGVTGAGHLDVAAVKAKLDEFAGLTSLPICVGFGIKDAETAASVARLADGVVIGSVLVDAISKHAEQPPEQIAEAVGAIISDIRRGLDSL